MSLEWWMTPHEKTRSKDASAKGRSSPSPRCTSPSRPKASRRARVVATAQSVRSTAVTRAPASAKSWTAKPLPQPTSSTSLPAKSANGTKRENGRPSGPRVNRSPRGAKPRESSSRKYSGEPVSAAMGSSTSYDIGLRFHHARTCSCVTAPSLQTKGARERNTLRLRVEALQRESPRPRPHLGEPRPVSRELREHGAQPLRPPRLVRQADPLALDERHEPFELRDDDREPGHQVLEQLVREDELVVSGQGTVDDEADLELIQRLDERRRLDGIGHAHPLPEAAPPHP